MHPLAGLELDLPQRAGPAMPPSAATHHHSFRGSATRNPVRGCWLRLQTVRQRRRRELAASHEQQTAAAERASYDWQQYRQDSSQREERAEWAASVRHLAQGLKQQAWDQAPQLDPPAVLSDVVLVLVGPKSPANIGTIARSCSAFECLQLRIVECRCIHTARNARSAAKGAQFILYQAQQHQHLADALSDCHVSVAFTRWVSGRAGAFKDVRSLLTHPTVRRCLQLPLLQEHGPGPQPGAAEVELAAEQRPAAEQPGAAGLQQQGELLGSSSELAQQGAGRALAGGSCRSEEAAAAGVELAQQGAGMKLALVFGREELGLSDDELAACDLACSIPIGRLQESLSLGHAVTVALSQLYQARQEALQSQ